MKRHIPIYILLIFILASCKKDKTTDIGKDNISSATLSNVSPSLVTVGTIVTIVGTNLGTSVNNVSVFFNGVQATVQSVTATEIKAVVPVTNSGELIVVIGDKTLKGLAYSVTSIGKITQILPASASVGAMVQIKCDSLSVSGPIKVTFNSVDAEVIGVSPTNIFVKVPNASTGNIIVTSGNIAVQGPVFTIIDSATISDISPKEVISGTVVTLIGSNFGTTTSGVQVLFNGKPGTIISILPNEIKVSAPVTTSGNVAISINGVIVTGPAFNYISPLLTPYVSGNVVLTSQAEVDAFVNLNKGKILQITGSLTISGNDISSTTGLSNITKVAQDLTVRGTMLSDLTFLKTLTSVGGNILLSDLAAENLKIDNLAGSVGAVTISSCKNLRVLSLRSLTKISGNIYSAGMSISGCDQLGDIDLSSLTEITNKLSIMGSAIRDLSKFSALQSAGSMVISSNPVLTSFKGLERLTALTTKPSSASLVLLSGLSIIGNTNLRSLDGLQNLIGVPIAQINQNPALAELCPAKEMLLKLSTAANYVYSMSSLNSISRTKMIIPALSLSKNGGFISKSDALNALALCK